MLIPIFSESSLSVKTSQTTTVCHFLSTRFCLISSTFFSAFDHVAFFALEKTFSFGSPHLLLYFLPLL